jgi:hypothetical protein
MFVAFELGRSRPEPGATEGCVSIPGYATHLQILDGIAYGGTVPAVATAQSSSDEELASLEFYNLKTKQKVEIPESQMKKRKSVRTTSKGTRQERYAVVADVDVDGKPIRMFKFVNKATFDSLHIPEVD